jgi:hypothetical protein
MLAEEDMLLDELDWLDCSFISLPVSNASK